jgi:2,5-dihydroxypyridine 5,6-dioxygenase
MAKDLTLLFTEQFQRCKLLPTEMVAIIAEPGIKQAHVDAAARAAKSIGAGAVVLQAAGLSHPILPPHRPGGAEASIILAAAGQCDLVVDLTEGGLIHSDVRTRIVGNGKRMLFVAEPADVLERLAGTPEIRHRVESGAARLKAARTLKVTSEAGTSLVADISSADLPITMQWGYVDAPGRWDHWPSGFIACFPRDLSAEGVIVLQPGDILLPWMRAVTDRIVINIEKGFIVAIEGAGRDAFMLKDYFDGWHDPNAFAVSHMGWGVHPMARFAALDVYESLPLFGQEFRSAEGNFMWSTGANRFAKRDTPAHLDIPMHSCSVQLDDEFVVRAGRLQ